MAMERVMQTTTRGTQRAEERSLPIYLASDQPQKKLPKRGDEGEGEAGKDGGPQKLAKRGKELKEEMDALIDEIDEVLEENAEEFVKNYVQRGGQ
jgi:ubiquitin-like protein Pup